VRGGVAAPPHAASSTSTQAKRSTGAMLALLAGRRKLPR
jgi:hypothetical protein